MFLWVDNTVLLRSGSIRIPGDHNGIGNMTIGYVSDYEIFGYVDMDTKHGGREIINPKVGSLQETYPLAAR